MSEHEPVAGLSEASTRETVYAVLALLPMSDDGTGHIAECGYTHDEPVCGCYDLPSKIAALLASHVARATADAEAIARLAEESEAGWRREADEQALRANNAEARLARAWEEGAYAGRDYQKRLHEYASSTHIGRSQPEHVPNPYAAPSAPTCSCGTLMDIPPGHAHDRECPLYATPSAPDPQEER